MRLVYLGRIGQIELLPALFSPVYVPEAVLLELDMGRFLRADTVDPRKLPWATVAEVPETVVESLPPNRLGIGERAAIACARAQGDCLVGLDDLCARQLAEASGLTVVGTLGILLRAKQAGLLVAVRPLMDELNAQGFRLSAELYQDVLELSGEAG